MDPGNAHILIVEEARMKSILFSCLALALIFAAPSRGDSAAEPRVIQAAAPSYPRFTKGTVGQEEGEVVVEITIATDSDSEVIIRTNDEGVLEYYRFRDGRYRKIDFEE